MLVVIERLSAAFSDHVIVSNHIWQGRLEQRSVSRPKLTTILNYPDTRVFHRRGKDRNDGKFIMIYPGTLSYHQGVDIAIRALSLIKEEVPEAELHIYGGGDQLDSLKSLICDLGLQNQVFLKDPLPTNEIALVIENADVGIVPKRKNGFGNEAFSTKILEFMSLGVPVIIPDTKVDSYYFSRRIAQFFRADDEKSLADTMILMKENPQRIQDLVLRACDFVKRYTWETNQDAYLNLVDSLLRSDGPNAPKRAPQLITMWP
jgi:glycosyltransferase involved in cell wall biosynthesis